MQELQLLHVYLDADVWQVVFFLFQFDHRLLCLAWIMFINLLEEALHILSGEPTEIIDLQVDNLGQIPNQLQAILGVLFNV